MRKITTQSQPGNRGAIRFGLALIALALATVGCAGEDIPDASSTPIEEGSYSSPTTSAEPVDSSASYPNVSFRWTDDGGWVRKVTASFRNFSGPSFKFAKSIEDSPPGSAKVLLDLEEGSFVIVDVTSDTPGRQAPDLRPYRVDAWFPASPDVEFIGPTIPLTSRKTTCVWAESIVSDKDTDDDADLDRQEMVEDFSKFNPESGMNCFNIAPESDRTGNQIQAYSNPSSQDEATVDNLLSQLAAITAPVVKIQLQSADYYDGSCTIYLFPDGTSQIGRFVQRYTNTFVGKEKRNSGPRCLIEHTS
jgi:hypothetical protein